MVGLHDGAARGAAEEQGPEGKTVGEIAKMQGKGIIDAFLDLAVEENLETAFLHGENNVDDDAVAKILNYPNAIIGLSDGGAHVQFQSGFGFSTRLLGEWVREKHIMSLETGGAAADLRSRPRCSDCTIAACCSRAWWRIS